jgi:superfamily II DNA or RNA helicase
MSLASRTASSFSESTKSKGRRYFENNQVSLDDYYDDYYLEAHVAGSRRRPYAVALDWSRNDNVLEVNCTCPHYDGGSLCKHIWATLLAADEAEVAEHTSGKGHLKVVCSDDEFADDDSYYGEDKFVVDGHNLPSMMMAISAHDQPAVVPAVSVKSRKPQRNSSRQSPSVRWQQFLNRFETVDQSVSFDRVWRDAERRQRILHFVIDLGRSAAAGKPSIGLFEQETRKDGTWGAIKQPNTGQREIDDFSADDQQLLNLLAGNRVVEESYGWYDDESFSERMFSRILLAPNCYETVLPQLAATGRLAWVVDSDEKPIQPRPLAWDEGPAWQFRLVIDANKNNKQWNVAAELYRGDETLAGGETLIVFPTGLLLTADAIALCRLPDDSRWIYLLGESERLVIPHADKSAFLAQLWRSGEAPETRGTADTRLPSQVGTPRGSLKVHRVKEHPGGYKPSTVRDLYATAAFDYDGTLIAPVDSRQAWVADDGARIVLRDEKREIELLTELAELKTQPNDHRYHNPDANMRFAANRLDGIVETLAARGWLIEAEGVLVRTSGSFQLSVASGVDWFDLEGSLEFGETQVALPALLEAVRQGEKYVRLDDGSRGMLPSQWLERFGPLADLATADGERLRFRPSQGMLLDALLAAQDSGTQVDVDRKFQQYRKKLRSFDGIKPADPPRGFQGTLRPYQHDGLGWLKFLNDYRLGGCLADDMGLGKTVQVLALLAGRRSRRLKQDETRRPSLVVVPKSLVFNWRQEAERFAPRLNLIDYTGLDRQSRASEIDSCDALITTYGTLRRDIATLKDIQFDYAILDESQAVKNATSQTAKACRLIQADHRLAMTGTPVENHLGELWSLFEFLNPGMLGRSTAFGRLVKGANGSAQNGHNGSAEPALDVLRQGLAPFILRRTKEQVLDDLPQKTEQTLHCELERAQRRKYDELREYYRQSLATKIAKKGLKQSKIHVLEALLRLRQAACHPGLLDAKLSDQPSAKLDALLDQVREVVAEGHKALVFSQFTSFLKIVRDRLDAEPIVYEYLDGKTRKRQERVERFQTDPACPLFLISLKAGGHGLNLTAADYVFLLDPWWNPAVEAQAIDRVHRIGQSRPVFAYRLIATDTVEEKIIELQSSKKALADSIITADANLMRSLTADDLQMLLS